jgi:hypothetical protein
MENPPTFPTISSFVIRFVQADAAGPNTASPPRATRGVIRHVQSDREIAFSRWQEALDFIQSFVTLEDNAPE